jgi:type II secretory pathway component PulF
MTTTPEPISNTQTFDYDAQAEDGSRFNGSLEAADAERAMNRLRSMRLRVTDLRLREALAQSSRPVRGSDFIAFNEQIAHLAAAGLPLEAGLRLIADELRHGRLANAVNALASDLEAGTPVAEAFEKRRGSFPPLYGRLVGAGVRSGNLSAILLSLGKHLELVQQLRAVLWRALSYPLFVLATAIGLLLFLAAFIFPKYAAIFQDFHLRLPGITLFMISVARVVPYIVGALVAIALILWITWLILSRTGRGMVLVEALVLPIPLIGPLLRAEMVARWCDAVRLGVNAGMDLPQSIELAADATGSRKLAADGRTLVAMLGAGQSLTALRPRTLPATVPTTIQLASGNNNLAEALGTLSDLYQRQAEMTLATLPTVLSPILVLIIALFIGFVVVSLMVPFVHLFGGLM